jgi:hypothetical protein
LLLLLHVQGMRNKVLNFALLFETFIAAAVVYIPPLNTGGLAGRASEKIRLLLV